LQDDEGMEAAQLEGVHSGLSQSDRGLRHPTSSLTLANATGPAHSRLAGQIAGCTSTLTPANAMVPASATAINGKR
jgi:hypothetical protein